MKIRKGFVSNSSSSSFVVIGNGDFESDLHKYVSNDGALIIGENGETAFGWNETKYSNLFSRINFAWLLTEYDDSGDTWKEMLEKALKEEFGCSRVISIIDTSYSDRDVDFVYGYIDHGSTSGESDNGKIFNNIDTLKRFLFCEDSYIQGDNDNH